MDRAKEQRRKEFAKKLGEAMKHRGWDPEDRGSRSKLARAVGAAASLVAGWVRGRTFPGYPYLLRLPAVLGISATALDVAKTGPTRPEPRHSTGGGGSETRAPRGRLLRALTAIDDQLRVRVAEGGVGQAEVAAIAANQAGQMLADRLAAVIRQTFEDNEIADTKAGRKFTIAFLDRIVEDFGALGLNVTDVARYAAELRRQVEEKP